MAVLRRSVSGQYAATRRGATSDVTLGTAAGIVGKLWPAYGSTGLSPGRVTVRRERRMPVLERSGVRLAYEEAGAGSPPIVLVHGWTCSHAHFAPQFEHFRAGHRVVAVDLRGHGASDAPEGDYSLAVLADDVAWLCEALQIEDAVVVGHSMGAALAVDLASRHPVLVSRLVLVDAAPIGAPADIGAVLSQVIDGLSGPDPASTRRFFAESLLFLPTDDADLKARVVGEMLATPDHVALGCMRGMAAWGGAAALREVEVPVLAIHAEQAINEPEKLAALCPCLTNARTPGVGHFNQLLAPDAVNRLIEEFIA